MAEKLMPFEIIDTNPAAIGETAIFGTYQSLIIDIRLPDMAITSLTDSS